MDAQPLDVLVLEDNPGDVRLIEEGLDASRPEVSTAVFHDGKAALEYLSRRNDDGAGTVPDAALLDLNVPKLTGRDVLDRISDEPTLRSIPLLVLSGSRSDTHVLET